MAHQPTEKAAEIYAATHNCAQTILDVCFENRDAATRQLLFDAATGLGGGLASSGSTCGALVGGLMALSLRLVEQQVPEQERSTRLKQLVAGFTHRNGAIDCRDLTGMNFDDKTITRCRQRVVDVVERVQALSSAELDDQA